MFHGMSRSDWKLVSTSDKIALIADWIIGAILSVQLLRSCLNADAILIAAYALALAAWALSARKARQDAVREGRARYAARLFKRLQA